MLGAPGVGKTTIMRLLVATGGFQRLPQTVSDEETEAASQAHRAFRSLLDRFEQSKFSRAHGSAIRNRIAVLGRTNRESRARIFVDDEGLLQRGLNLAEFEPSHDLFFDYYWSVPVPDVVVVVRAQPARLVVRNRGRAHESPRSDRGPQRFFLSWVTDIAALILSARGVPCVIIDNDDAPELGASRIIDALRQSLGPSEAITRPAAKAGPPTPSAIRT